MPSFLLGVVLSLALESTTKASQEMSRILNFLKTCGLGFLIDGALNRHKPYLITRSDAWKRGRGKGHPCQRPFFKCLFLPFCRAPSPSMISLQQTLKLSLHIHTVYSSTILSRVSIQSQPPSLSFPIFTNHFDHTSHILPLSLHLFFHYSPLTLPFIFQSYSIWQSNSCPLTSPITITSVRLYC